MSERPRVLVLAYSDLGRDPRVSRQIRFLSGDYRVVAAGTGAPEIDGVDFVPLAVRAKPLTGKLASAARLISRRYESFYRASGFATECLRRLRDVRADLVLANDVDALGVALELAGPAPVVFDAHEYSPAQRSDRLLGRALFAPYRSWLCRTYMPRARTVTTVSEGIAEQYARDTGVRPRVVWNAPDYEALEPGRVSPERIRLVHHGLANRSRHLERTIRMMEHLDERFELHLMLVAAGDDHVRDLKEMAAGDSRIHFPEPVPMRAIPAALNRFDVGVYLLPPANFNHRHALPNKLFEFVQARLAIGIGPSPEMARLVKEHDLGLVSDDFSPRSLARELSGLTVERLARFKANAHAAARQLSSEPGRERLLEIVRCALAERRSA